MEDCLALLASRGLRVLPTRIAVDADGAVEAARELGFPVVAKLLSAAVIHKSEAGAVRVGLRSPRALRSACREMLAAAGDRPVEGFAVQPVAPDGVELIVGFRRDPAFGPVIVVGHGGTLVEVIRDVSLRVAPVDPAEADEMLSGLSGSRVLAGARGRPAVDRDAIARFVASFSWLAIEHPMVEQLEVNPLIAAAEGCQAVDVRGFALASGRRAGRA
jgi:succinyl-CoA synthetase beta subunit